jgi:hypothetical protein
MLRARYAPIKSIAHRIQNLECSPLPARPHGARQRRARRREHGVPGEYRFPRPLSPPSRPLPSTSLTVPVFLKGARMIKCSLFDLPSRRSDAARRPPRASLLAYTQASLAAPFRRRPRQYGGGRLYAPSGTESLGSSRYGERAPRKARRANVGAETRPELEAGAVPTSNTAFPFPLRRARASRRSLSRFGVHELHGTAISYSQARYHARPALPPPGGRYPRGGGHSALYGLYCQLAQPWLGPRNHGAK